MFIKKSIKPSEIIEWISRLNDILDGEGSRLIDWSYPSPYRITFTPGKNVDNSGPSKKRTQAIFQHVVLEDPLRKSSRGSFNLDPISFLRKAQRLRPVCPLPTVSGFSQWVYSLYASDTGDEEDRERGKDTEKAIWELNQAANTFSPEYARNEAPLWKLVHNGLHTRENSDLTYFEIGSLSVGGAPLRASPDLIFFNREESETIIVEIKSSFMDIPENLWPNLWAQLWCYSKIEPVEQSSKVTVVGEVWAHKTRVLRKLGELTSIHLRASVRRDPRKPSFDRFFGQLFNIYRGQ